MQPFTPEHRKIPYPNWQIAVLAVLTLAGCRSLPPASTPTSDSLPTPVEVQPAPGAVAYIVNPAASELRVLVYRDGALASFGHNHVLLNRQVGGTIYWHTLTAQTRFALEAPVAAFIVDEPAARAEEGEDFTSRPDAEAIAGTRANLLGPEVLDAARYPTISIRSLASKGPAWQPDVTAAITLHGVTRQITVPVAVFKQSTSLTVSGSFTLKQSDFGITPFSILGGAIQVRDEVRIRFRLRAKALQ